MIWILNMVILVMAVAVFVGWIRNRRRDAYRDIKRAEISSDLKAQDELLEDALSELNSSRSEWAAAARAMPRDRED
jgi:hypothetical protein